MYISYILYAIPHIVYTHFIIYSNLKTISKNGGIKKKAQWCGGRGSPDLLRHHWVLTCAKESQFSLEMENHTDVVNHTELCAHHPLELMPMMAGWLCLLSTSYVAELRELLLGLSPPSPGYSSAGWTLSSLHLSLGYCVHPGQGHRACMCRVYCVPSLYTLWMDLPHILWPRLLPGPLSASTCFAKITKQNKARRQNRELQLGCEGEMGAGVKVYLFFLKCQKVSLCIAQVSSLPQDCILGPEELHQSHIGWSSPLVRSRQRKGRKSENSFWHLGKLMLSFS